MGRWSSLLLLLLLAQPAMASVSLPCAPAMACCDTGLADCDLPGMTQDCCQLVDGGGVRIAIASPAALHVEAGMPALVPSTSAHPSLPERRPSACVAAGAAARVPGFFARTCVLRI